MNFKRGRAKNQRSGCLMCKSWKVNGFGKNRKDFETMSSHKQRIFSQEALQNYYEEEMADFFDDNVEYNLTTPDIDDIMGTERLPFRSRESYYTKSVYVPVVKPREFVASF